jgi:hypothetical protein
LTILRSIRDSITPERVEAWREVYGEESGRASVEQTTCFSLCVGPQKLSTNAYVRSSRQHRIRPFVAPTVAFYFVGFDTVIQTPATRCEALRNVY